LLAPQNQAISLRFVTNRDLPATNNGSERALRPCAVFRKITNGFRTQWGAELYADIRSIV
jgi:transposase